MMYVSLFFKGARHTYAQMAGRNVANPTAMLLSGADMLDHIKYVGNDVTLL